MKSCEINYYFVIKVTKRWIDNGEDDIVLFNVKNGVFIQTKIMCSTIMITTIMITFIIESIVDVIFIITTIPVMIIIIIVIIIIIIITVIIISIMIDLLPLLSAHFYHLIPVNICFFMIQGKQVEDNKIGAASGAVSKHKERKYRQYMNRKGTFLYLQTIVFWGNFCTKFLDKFLIFLWIIWNFLLHI